MFRIAAVGIAALVAAVSLASTAYWVTAAEPTRPNIVLIYMDDVSPHDGRLWTDPDLTPTLYKRFVERGIHFENAIGETPVCCPGRAGLLTGLHTHNHGVTRNDARLFKPGMHIGKALKGAGYATMFIGKYMNNNKYLTDEQWIRHGRGWTHLDVIKGVNGDYLGYTVHTKTGNVRYDDTHSTEMVAQRALMRFREAPPETPIFAVLSVYNLHGPNTPMPAFAHDARCIGMDRYKPPNYNEADVSDKPLYVQNQPLLTDPYLEGWPMVRYCREMLGIDWLTQQVVDELAAQDRLQNTLLVFTADNGSHWGIHRLGQSKLTPYAAPIPLYMSWPAKWGTTRVDVSDVASNIDLAPTFCALAESCTLGPYPTGQSTPDGHNLGPILDDPVAGLVARSGVLESAFTKSRTWHGIRTSPHSNMGFWHYVEWADGSVELYDLVADPWELESQHANSKLASVKAELAKRLADLWAEGRVATP